MTNIATVLKVEIVRVARKEIRSELEGLKKANTQHRSAIAELRRELAALQRQLKQADRERTASAREKTAAERKHRFSATRLAAHRTKLGLSGLHPCEGARGRGAGQGGVPGHRHHHDG